MLNVLIVVCLVPLSLLCALLPLAPLFYQVEGRITNCALTPVVGCPGAGAGVASTDPAEPVFAGIDVAGR
jgi:hypothetical protein